MAQNATVANKDLVGPLPLDDESFREYSYTDNDGNIVGKYRVDNPKQLYYRKGGTTHRVVDSNGETHCVLAPGFHKVGNEFIMCSLKWKASPAVAF